MNRRPCSSLVGGCALALLLTAMGCARLPSAARRPTAGVPEPAAETAAPPAWQGGPPVAVFTQYRPTVVVGMGHATFEVFVTHRGREPLRFTGVTLDGTEVTDAAADDVTWFQFYPSAELAPGSTIALQLGLRHLPRTPRQLELRVDDPKVPPLAVTVPPFARPARALAALTFSSDGREGFLLPAFPGADAPIPAVRGISFNGAPIPRLRTLAAPAGLAACPLVAFVTPTPVRTGQPVHVAVTFTDGSCCHALVRALVGVSLDAYGSTQFKPPASLLLDTRPPVRLVETAMQGDVACEDTRLERHGFHAPAVCRERATLFETRPDELAAIHFCTGCYTGLWSIYGAVADMTYCNPLSWHHGAGDQSWFGDELRHLAWTRAAVAPRPFGYIPEAYSEGRPFPDAGAFRTLVWSALCGGAKGLRYFAFDFNSPASARGFALNAPLRSAVTEINGLVREHAALFAPLVPMGVERPATPEDVELTAAWAGRAGMLVLVRNLRWRAEPAAAGDGTPPPFAFETRRDLRVPVRVPPWVTAKGARDLIGGQELPHSQPAAGLVLVTLPALCDVALVWLPARAPAWL